MFRKYNISLTKYFPVKGEKDDADLLQDFPNQSLNFPSFYDCSYAICNHRVISFLCEESVLVKGEMFSEQDNDGSIAGRYAPLELLIHMLKRKNNNSVAQTNPQPA